MEEDLGGRGAGGGEVGIVQGVGGRGSGPKAIDMTLDSQGIERDLNMT